jgi:hypothetical protein
MDAIGTRLSVHWRGCIVAKGRWGKRDALRELKNGGSEKASPLKKGVAGYL